MDIKSTSKEDIKQKKLIIPIPMDKNQRMINIQDFSYYAYQAIENIQKNPNY